jgi:hypothetical protein
MVERHVVVRHRPVEVEEGSRPKDFNGISLVLSTVCTACLINRFECSFVSKLLRMHMCLGEVLNT